MSLASFMQDAHHRRKDFAVPEHTRVGSSISSSDDDASATMATTKSGALAHRLGSHGRRHLPGRYRQHQASIRPGHPSCLHRRRPAARLSTRTRTRAPANSVSSAGELSSARCLSDSLTVANNWPRPVQARKPAARGNGHRLHATAPTRSYHPGSRTSQPESFGHRPSRWFSPNAQHRPPSLRCRSSTVTTFGCKVSVLGGW
jgi:hypothetical protein